MTCDFETVETAGKYQHTCKRCKAVRVTTTPTLVRQCDSELPSLAKQAKSATLSTIRWVAAGRPIRSKEEQVAILAICRECPEYLTDKNRCSKCGCHLRQKTKMSTEHCPESKW